MNFIEDLKTKVFCRLAPSKVHGIGVIAIRPIPAGINPMEEIRTYEFMQVPVKEINDDPEIPSAVKNLVVDFCPEDGTDYDVPPFSLNEIDIAWYLNHSDTPNMEERDGFFFSIREIADGEELTVDYGTYGKLNL